jgi:hypothetical protein
MYSIWFYFMPNGTAFEACGYNSQEEARDSVDCDSWFTDDGGNIFFINNILKQSAVIQIEKTA